MKINENSTSNILPQLPDLRRVPSIFVNQARDLAQKLYKKFSITGTLPFPKLPHNNYPIKNPAILDKAALKKPESGEFQYLHVALVIAVLAAAVLPFCLSLGLGLAALSGAVAGAALVKWISANSKKSVNAMIRFVHHLDSAVSELVASIRTIVTSCMLDKKFYLPSGYPHGRPILMINGYLGSEANWYQQKSRLAKEGFGPIYTVHIGSFESIEDYALEVSKKVKAIQKETHRKDVIFICHSKGGLVGSYYATRFAKQDKAKITDLITIGSPFSGTPVANFGVGKDAEQMRPDHPFHRELRNELKKHPEIRLFCIGSNTDLIVPLQSALSATDDPTHQKVFKNLGHCTLIQAPETTRQICRWLDP